MRYLKLIDKAALSEDRLSASQIATYLRCPRKWAYEKILGRTSPETSNQKLGKLVHTHLEHYLAHGKPPPNDKAGRIAASAIGDLPLPGVVETEREFCAAIGEAHFIGYVDFELDDLGKVSSDSLGPVLANFRLVGNGVTGDHKTSKNPEQYARTEDDLILDPQRILYTAAGAQRALDRGENPNSWIAYWNYIATTGTPRTLPVVVVQDLRDGSLDEYLDRIIVSPSSEMMLAKKQKAAPADLRGNVSACDDFGGCRHADICPRSARIMLPSLAEMKAARLGKPVEAKPTETAEAPIKAKVGLTEALRELTAPAKGEVNPPDAAPTPAEPPPKAPKKTKAAPAPASSLSDLGSILDAAIDRAYSDKDYRVLALLAQAKAG